MSAGGVIPRTPIPQKPGMKFGALSPLRQAEPIFDYLVATAERTLQIQERELEVLEKILAAIEKRN